MTKYLLIITIVFAGKDLEVIQIPTQSEAHCKHVYKEFLKEQKTSLFGYRPRVHGQCLNVKVSNDTTK